MTFNIYQLIIHTLIMIIVFMLINRGKKVKKDIPQIPVQKPFIQHDVIDYKKAFDLVSSISKIIVDKVLDLKTDKELPIEESTRVKELAEIITMVRKALSKDYLQYFKDNVIDLDLLISYYCNTLYNNKSNELNQVHIAEKNRKYYEVQNSPLSGVENSETDAMKEFLAMSKSEDLTPEQRKHMQNYINRMKELDKQ